MAKDIVRYSIFRLFSDLIRADKVVAEEEINLLTKICNDYGITDIDRENTLNVSLGEAVNKLSIQRRSLRNQIIEDMKQMSLSDGFCCREEALLLMAATLCIQKDQRNMYKVISSPCINVDFDDSQAIYLESSRENIYNDYITNNHRQLSAVLKLAGFEFVYIPFFAKHYRHTNQDLLRNIVALLAPTLKDEETNEVMQCINNMTTIYFYREIVCKKIKMKIDVSTPILLIKIGNSIVNGINNANFLSVKLEKDMLPQIEKLTDLFMKLQRCPTIEIRNNIYSKGDFIYTGFYKTLFDLLTTRKGSRCSLIINIPDRIKRKILSVNTNENNEFLRLNGKDAIFYVFILFESIINDRFQLGRFDKEIEKQKRKFEWLYSRFSNRVNNAPDISANTITSPMLTHIKNAINNNEWLIEKNMYHINRHTNGSLDIGLESHLVFVRQGNAQPVPLEDSDLFINYRQI